MSGFIALHREAFDHPLLKDGERFRAWFWLVANAAYMPTRHDARGKMIEVQRGQICAGREYLAKVWGWSASAVERFLVRLETEQMIERETGQLKTVITIRNYDKYQDLAAYAEHMSGQSIGQKPDRNRTAKEQRNQDNHNPSDISYPQDEAPAPDLTVSEKPSSRPRKPKPEGIKPHPMPADWQPGTLPPKVAALADLWPPGRLEREAEACRDYWLDRPTEKRPGWDRTFHNRIRDIHERVLKESRNDHQFRNGSQPRSERRSSLSQALDLAEQNLFG